MPPEVLVSITFKDAPGEALAQTEQSDSPGDRSASPAPSNDSVVGSQACSLCALSFASVDDQRSHLKSDFHNYNLKQKLRGGKLVTEDAFERLIAGKSSLPDLEPFEPGRSTTYTIFSSPVL